MNKSDQNHRRRQVSAIKIKEMLLLLGVLLTRVLRQSCEPLAGEFLSVLPLNACFFRSSVSRVLAGFHCNRSLEPPSPEGTGYHKRNRNCE